MSREQRKRADGTAIDSLKNLEEFVQSFPKSTLPDPPEEKPKVEAKPKEEPKPEVPPAEPNPAPAPVADPEFAGKSPEELIALAKKERERNAEIERQAREARAELEATRTQRQIEDTARRVIAEQQTPAPQQAPAPDPRLAQVEELWFLEPAKARALWKQIQDEEYEQRLTKERETIKTEVFTTLGAQQQRQQAEYAYHAALQELQRLGVPSSHFDANRVTAVYAAITRQPTATAPNPYFTAGGPLNQNAIVAAWRDLYGLPTQTPAPPPPVQTQTPTIPPPPMAAPPGSGRPAPAAAAPSQARAVPIDANTKRDLEHLAEAYGLKAENLINRRRARLAEGK